MLFLNMLYLRVINRVRVGAFQKDTSSNEKAIESLRNNVNVLYDENKGTRFISNYKDIILNGKYIAAYNTALTDWHEENKRDEESSYQITQFAQ